MHRLGQGRPTHHRAAYVHVLDETGESAGQAGSKGYCRPL